MQLRLDTGNSQVVVLIETCQLKVIRIVARSSHSQVVHLEEVRRSLLIAQDMLLSGLNERACKHGGYHSGSGKADDVEELHVRAMRLTSG